jgi:hypothetical protein
MVVAAPPTRTPLSPDHALMAASTTSSWSVRTIGNFPKSNPALMVATSYRAKRKIGTDMYRIVAPQSCLTPVSRQPNYVLRSQRTHRDESANQNPTDLGERFA